MKQFEGVTGLREVRSNVILIQNMKSSKKTKTLEEEEDAMEALHVERPVKAPKKDKSKKKDKETIEIESTNNKTSNSNVFVASDLLPSVHSYLLHCGYSKSASYLVKEAGPAALEKDNSTEDLLNVYTFYKNNQIIIPLIKEERETLTDLKIKRKARKPQPETIELENKPTKSTEELKPDKVKLKQDRKRQLPVVEVTEIKVSRITLLTEFQFTPEFFIG